MWILLCALPHFPFGSGLLRFVANLFIQAPPSHPALGTLASLSAVVEALVAALL